jgi:hypothetical protein
LLSPYFCRYTASCAKSLCLKPAIQLPTPLWLEVMRLMGGEFLQIADEVAHLEGDEVVGDD